MNNKTQTYIYTVEFPKGNVVATGVASIVNDSTAESVVYSCTTKETLDAEYIGMTEGRVEQYKVLGANGRCYFVDFAPILK